MLINSVMKAVGSTPLIRLSKMSSGNVFVKTDLRHFTETTGEVEW